MTPADNPEWLAAQCLRCGDRGAFFDHSDAYNEVYCDCLAGRAKQAADYPDNPEAPVSELDRLRGIERRAYDVYRLARINRDRAEAIHDQALIEWEACWDAMRREANRA